MRIATMCGAVASAKKTVRQSSADVQKKRAAFKYRRATILSSIKVRYTMVEAEIDVKKKRTYLAGKDCTKLHCIER